MKVVVGLAVAAGLAVVGVQVYQSQYLPYDGKRTVASSGYLPYD